MGLIAETFRVISGKTYISEAANASSFEILIVQFVNGDFQISGCLKFHKTSAVNDDKTGIAV